MKKIAVLLVMFALVLTSSVASKASDVELIGGGVTWWNDLAKGNALYSEGMYWFDGEYSPGLGAYGMLENGESKVSDYEWDGDRETVQAGFKRYWLANTGYRKIEGQDWEEAILYPRQWQLKIRYGVEHQRGENKSSSYSMTQDNTVLGLYGEYVAQTSYRWKILFIAEGWKTLSKKKSSTLDNEVPESRDQYSASLGAQYRMTDTLGIRVVLSPFYQDWDKMFGGRVQAEVRIYETVMAGGYISRPFTVPEVYEQYNANEGNLTTYGLFARIEF